MLILLYIYSVKLKTYLDEDLDVDNEQQPHERCLC
jgi:hypothetical protein